MEFLRLRYRTLGNVLFTEASHPIVLTGLWGWDAHFTCFSATSYRDQARHFCRHRYRSCCWADHLRASHQQCHRAADRHRGSATGHRDREHQYRSDAATGAGGRSRSPHGAGADGNRTAPGPAAANRRQRSHQAVDARSPIDRSERSGSVQGAAETVSSIRCRSRRDRDEAERNSRAVREARPGRVRNGRAA